MLHCLILLMIHAYRSSPDEDHSTEGEGGNNRSGRCYGRVKSSKGEGKVIWLSFCNKHYGLSLRLVEPWDFGMRNKVNLRQIATLAVLNMYSWMFDDKVTGNLHGSDCFACVFAWNSTSLAAASLSSSLLLCLRSLVCGRHIRGWNHVNMEFWCLYLLDIKAIATLMHVLLECSRNTCVSFFKAYGRMSEHLTSRSWKSSVLECYSPSTLSGASHTLAPRELDLFAWLT